MNAFLRNRGLWCFGITMIAMILVYQITKPGHRLLELSKGASFAIVAAVVIGLLVLLVIKSLKKKVAIPLLYLIVGAVVLIALGAVLQFNPHLHIGLNHWWDTRGFFAGLILIAAAVGCYLLWETPSRPQAQQPATTPHATTTSRAVPVS